MISRKVLAIGITGAMILGIVPIGYAAWTQRVNVSACNLSYEIADISISGGISFIDLLPVSQGEESRCLGAMQMQGEVIAPEEVKLEEAQEGTSITGQGENTEEGSLQQKREDSIGTAVDVKEEDKTETVDQKEEDKTETVDQKEEDKTEAATKQEESKAETTTEQKEETKAEVSDS